MSDAPPAAHERRAIQLPGDADDATWGIAVEAAVELRLNGTPWTVMLATPTDLEDLAVGLAITEQVVTSASQLGTIVAASFLGDHVIDLAAPGVAAARSTRAMAGVSGCGLCGLESLAALRAAREALPGGPPAPQPVADDAILAAWDAMPRLQPINRVTHSVHAAAWCTLDGTVALVREDVGRHNALDKLVGALARANRLGEPGFVAMSSRCSYELVAKAAIARAALLATLSAPTTMALAWAEALGVPVACRGPGDRVVRFPWEVAHATG